MIFPDLWIWFLFLLLGSRDKRFSPPTRLFYSRIDCIAISYFIFFTNSASIWYQALVNIIIRFVNSGLFCQFGLYFSLSSLVNCFFFRFDLSLLQILSTTRKFILAIQYTSLLLSIILQWHYQISFPQINSVFYSFTTHTIQNFITQSDLTIRT